MLTQFPHALGHLPRWMCFVDGENLTFRAQHFAANEGFSLVEGPYYREDVFVWLPLKSVRDVILWNRQASSYQTPIRTYYYTSLVGSPDQLNDVEKALWQLDFDPTVFKKAKRDEKAKGVDITLSTHFLGHAFRHDYDVAFLFAGDGDYVPLVAEAKPMEELSVFASSVRTV